MADTVTTLRPNAEYGAHSGTWALTGAADRQTALSDDADGSYVSTASSAFLTFDMSTFTVPALAILRSVTLRVRASVSSGAGKYLAYIVDGLTGNAAAGYPTMTAPGSPASQTVYSITSRPFPGGPLTQAFLDAIRVQLGGASAFSGSPGVALIYEAYLDVAYNQAPTAGSLAASGTDSSQPTLSAAYSDPEGDVLERSQWAVFGAPVADPFGANLASAVWYSGELLTGVTSAQVGVPLANQTTYTWYVRFADAGSSGRYGPAASSSFTVTVDPAGVPVLSVPYADPNTAAVENLTVQVRHNLLSKATANLEDGVGGWLDDTNCSVAQSTDQAFRGTQSLKVTATADGDMWATTVNARPAVNGGELYTALITVFAGATARTARVYLRFWDGGGSFIGQVNAEGVEHTGTWLRLWATARAPAAAASVDIVAQWLGCAGSEVHYVDCAAVLPATENPVDNSDFNDALNGWSLGHGGTSTAALVTNDGKDFGALTASSVDLNRAEAAYGAFVIQDHHLAMKAGETFIVSAWVKVYSDNGGRQAMVQLINDAGTPLGTAYLAGAAPGVWTVFAAIITCPGGTDRAGVRVCASDVDDSTSRAHILVDEIMVQRINTGLVNGTFESTVSSSTVARQDNFDGIGWTIESYPNITGVQDATVFHSGAHSLRLGGPSLDVAANTWHIAAQDVYVGGRTSMTFDYWWRVSNMIGAHAKIRFFDAARQLVTLSNLGGTLPAGVTNANDTLFLAGTSSAGDTGWLHQSYAGLPVPPGAVYASFQFLGGWSFDGTSAGFAWFDDLTLALASPAAPSAFMPGGWSVGGLTTINVFVERSAYVGGTWQPWQPVRWPQGAVYATFPGGYPDGATPWRLATTDFEAPFGTPVIYRTRMIASDAGASSASVAWAYPQAFTVDADGDWLKDPRRPDLNIPICLEAPGTSTSDERQVVSEPLDRAAYFVQGDVVRGEVLALAFTFDSDAEWQAFETLRKSQAVLLLQTQWGGGTGGYEQFYVRLGPTRSVTRVARNGTGTQLRMVTIQAREVSTPTT